MAARRTDPRAHGDERELIRRLNEDEPVQAIMPLGPSDLVAIGRALGYGANMASKLAAIHRAGGIAKSSSALVDEAAMLLKGSGRSLKQAVAEVKRAAVRIAKREAIVPASEAAGAAPARGIPPINHAAHNKRVAELIEERAATPKTQADLMREAAQAKRDLVHPPARRTIEARELKAAREAAAEAARKAEMKQAVAMRSKPGDPLNKDNLGFKDEVLNRSGNYRSHKPPVFDEAEIERGTASEKAFRRMRNRHSPDRVTDIGPDGKNYVGGKPAGGENTGGNNVGADLSEEVFARTSSGKLVSESADAAAERQGQYALEAKLRRIAKSELKPKQ